jgi:nudix-type nucleoside diphosphatase (YffH/AdpP family)
METPLICNSELILDGFFTVTKVHIQYKDEDELLRLVVMPKPAVAILLHLTDSNSIILIKQFRLAAALREKEDGLLLEIPAGVVDKENETLEETAIRECVEETGYRPRTIKRIFDFFTSPGYSCEKLCLFYACAHSSDKISNGGGLKEENEKIEVMEISLDDAMNLVSSGGIIDAKTILALQWLKLKS